MQTVRPDEVRKILYVAFHFPPQSGSSGLLRTLKFCRYLPERGWLPVVLTLNNRAYERLDHTQMKEIPPEVPVIRAFGLDTQRHLSIRGRYFRWMALPDRWVSWCLGAVPAGLRLIRKHSIDIILTTFPIVTAVLIGLILHRLTGKPWVVDFRDPITEDEYPADPFVRKIHRWIERQALERGSLFLFTSPSTLQMYCDRYLWLPREKCRLIPNGYDEEDFQSLDYCAPAAVIDGDRTIHLLHAGLLYPEYRDPSPLLRAMAQLKNEGRLSASDLRVALRAPGYETYYSEVIQQLGVQDLVQLLPAVSYREALQEGAAADGLLLFQGAPCNHQIPAKAYEYMRLCKPILALTPPGSDTAVLLRGVGGTTTVDLADENGIYQALPRFLKTVREGSHPLPDPEKTMRYARKSQAYELADNLTQVVSQTKAHDK